MEQHVENINIAEKGNYQKLYGDRSRLTGSEKTYTH